MVFNSILGGVCRRIRRNVEERKVWLRRTVTLKLRDSEFNTMTKSVTISDYLNKQDEIYSIAAVV